MTHSYDGDIKPPGPPAEGGMHRRTCAESPLSKSADKLLFNDGYNPKHYSCKRGGYGGEWLVEKNNDQTGVRSQDLIGIQDNVVL